MNTIMRRIALGLVLCGLPTAGFILAQRPNDVGESTLHPSGRDAQIRYARAYLELAKVELQLAQEANKIAPETMTRKALQRKRNNVKVAEEQFRVALLPPSQSDAVDIHLRYAEEKARLAKRAYQQALEMENRELVYNDLQLQQLQLQAEVAQLRLAVWSDPANVMSLLGHMHWQVERLSEAVVDLQRRLDEIE